MARASKRTLATGPMGQVFGVRHLSPAGARHLLRFIEDINPTAIVIEGPSDADVLLQHLAHSDTQPPVALLAFTHHETPRSMVYPLASYSPEWVALQEGLRRGCLVRFMDLPSNVMLADQVVSQNGFDSAGFLDDPWTAIAHASGEPDHETWWEKNFEHTPDVHSYRETITALGRELRVVRHDSPEHHAETLRREAYMRRVLRGLHREGHAPDRIVIVCGAFHSTALVLEEPPMTDAEHKALARVSTTLTVMPYSHYRLSSQSGYGAGNHAPAHFQRLWEQRESQDETHHASVYMSHAAAALRADGRLVSSADVMEAVRLAHALAAMSEHSVAPCLRDLRDAAVTCLAHGNETTFDRVRARVEVGDVVGRVASGVPRTALQEDFHRHVQALRMQPYLRDRAQTVHSGDPRRDKQGELIAQYESQKPWLDLRVPLDRSRSVFLRRLLLLNVPFVNAVPSEREPDEPNTFKEEWTVQWSPECEVRLAETSLKGDTLEQASLRAMHERLAYANTVFEAARQIEHALRCDLRNGVALAQARLEELAVVDQDFVSLAEASCLLHELARYQLLQTDVDLRLLLPLVAQLFLQCTLALESARHCAEEHQNDVAHAMQQAHALTLSADTAFPLAVDRWMSALMTCATHDDHGNAFLAGTACALLLDSGALSDDALEVELLRRLSSTSDPVRGALFFEGLLSRNHAALVARTHVWSILNTYVEGLDDSTFMRVVALLRRAFSHLSPGESRRVMSTLSRLWHPTSTQPSTSLGQDDELAALNEQLADLDWD